MKKEDVIIISDLHLNEGVNSPNEDFFYDEEFSRFLKSLKKKTKLIINGDFVDFLQVVELPTKTAGLRRSEIIYGLNTEEEKSVWKLRYVIHNHRIFFNALIDFVIKGNKIVIIKGNHDVEFFWPRVKQSFYQELNKINPHKNIKNNISYEKLRKIDELKLAPLMEKSHFIFRAAFYHVFEHKIYHNAAKKIKRLLNVKYVAFGHTHNKEASKSYFNTGTWTPRVYHEFTQLQTVKNLTYLKISNGKASLLEWK